MPLTMTRSIAGRRWAVSFCLLLLGGLALPAPVAHAANTLHVTSCADSGANTLRGQIAAALAGDTIVFDQNCTITLTTGTLTLTQIVTIDGSGHTVAVDGNNAVGVFAVNSGVTANLTALTIQHGSTQSLTAGAGISNSGTLTVANTTISGNTAAFLGGGILNDLGGTVTVTNCTIANNTVSDQQQAVAILLGGGGIYNRGTLTVVSSTLSGNHAGYNNDGGGILNDNGTVTVTNSTLTGNTAYESGGGGIKSDGGTVTVTNSTLTGNTAFHGGGLDGVNISEHGGTRTLTNTIVAGNLPAAHREVNGAVTSGGHNLIGDADGSTGWGASDLTGTDASPLNPLLGPLGSYGGATQTVPLLPGSPALSAGASGAGIPTTDQRGVARTGHTDIGAFQSQGFTITKTGGDNQGQHAGNAFPAPLTFTVAGAGAPYNEPVQGGQVTVTPPAAGASAILSGVPASLPADGKVSMSATANGTVGGPYSITVSAGATYTTAFSLTNLAVVPHGTYTVGTSADHAVGSVSEATCRTAGNTTCALRDALIYANSGTDTVAFKAGIGPAIILVAANGPLVLTANVTIAGPGAAQLAIDGGCTGCDPGGTPSGGVTVLVVNGGVTASISGLTIRHGSGGIANNGTLTVTNGTISGNRTSDRGGGIANNGTLTVTNSTITGNVAGNDGGGIFNQGTLTVTNSTLSGNSTTTQFGGGIFNNGTLTVTNSTLANNAASLFGGGISNSSTATVTNSRITGNTASAGGGIHSEDTLTVTNSTLSGNTAALTSTGGGGAIYNTGDTATVTSSTLSDNAGGNGGAIINAGILTVTNSTFAGNRASNGDGGGIYNLQFSALATTNSTFASNSATGRGGGIFNADALFVVQLTNTIVTGNMATTSGPDLGGAIATTGHNLFGTTGGARITLGPGDLVDSNPRLGTLGYNGGTTQTVPLLQGSPAIDAGDDAVCAGAAVGGKDQRGIARPVGTHCDIGAFEYQQVNTLPGTKPTVPAGSPPNPLPGSRPAGTTGGPAPNPIPQGRP